MSKFKAIMLVFALALVIGVGINLITADQVTTPANAAGSGWFYEGCWAYFPAGPCYDIYQDAQGTYWICKLCGQTKNPGPKVCRIISELTLSRGYWCS